MTRQILLPALLCLLSLFAQAAPKPDIVLITLDSVRADRMGFLGSSQRLTPNLDRLAKDSLIFRRAYSQSPLTLTSHVTLLSGNYPQSHRVIDLGVPLASSVPYLPALLQAQGYHTAAFVASAELNPKCGYAPGLERGFDEYSSGGASTRDRSAAQTSADAVAWLARNKKPPFFVWLELPGPLGTSSASYAAGIRAQDSSVGKLISALQSQKLLDNVLVVVAADHGQSLGAHGESTHGIFLYDETIHVPLLLKLPGNKMGGKSLDDTVRLVDVAPSILEAAGLPVASSMQGESLLRMARTSASEHKPAYSRTDLPSRGFGWSPLESWRSGKYLLIRAPKPELYDLESDPGATHNLSTSKKAVYDTLASQLEAFSTRLQKQPTSSGSTLSSSELQKLASLGYVGLQHSTAVTEVTGTDPKDKIAVANSVLRARDLIDSSRTSAATLILKKAVSSAPGAYLVQYGLGESALETKDYKSAIEHLHKAIALVPDSALAHLAMGKALIGAGDWKTAVTHLEIAAARLPEVTEAQRLLNEARNRAGK
jgi:arylsulfatase A-like enzyme